MAEDIVVAELLDTLDSADTFGPAGDTFVGAAAVGTFTAAVDTLVAAAEAVEPFVPFDSTDTLVTAFAARYFGIAAKSDPFFRSLSCQQDHQTLIQTYEVKWTDHCLFLLSVNT